MIYCLNPSCSKPKNPNHVEVCQTCGTELHLNTRYLVKKTLGQGGFGATFLAVDTGLPGDPVCVIKQLRPSNTSENFLKMARELFEREAETLGRLGNHPQIPRLLDYFEEKEQFFLVQEFVNGANLQRYVKENGPFTEVKVRQFLTEILPLFEYIHSQKVIHRDIKPANIIRRDVDNKLVLIDFGAVKNRVEEVMAESGDDSPLTSFAVGTPGYASPEQMSMRPTYASDIYSLGATCVYLLTGKSPKDIGYDAETGMLNWEKQVTVSKHFKGILNKMLDMSVRDRYQSPQAVLDAIELEAYSDTLSQGLVQAKPTESTPATTETESEQSYSRRTAQIAESIRKRRTRQGLPTSQSRETTQAQGSGAMTAGKTKSGTSRKLNAKDVITQYQKGRRDFSKVNLYRLNLEETTLKQAIFRNTNLMQVNFHKADLREADFANAVLRRGILREAKLNHAFFSQADLQKADLRKADLTLANFSNAKLTDANLCGANLTNAKITEEQLAEVQTNWATIMPNGKRALW